MLPEIRGRRESQDDFITQGDQSRGEVREPLLGCRPNLPDIGLCIPPSRLELISVSQLFVSERSGRGQRGGASL
jgi:hypothetical protein